MPLHRVIVQDVTAIEFSPIIVNYLKNPRDRSKNDRDALQHIAIQCLIAIYFILYATTPGNRSRCHCNRVFTDHG